MFPHKKYFSSVPCPDNEEGECVRPYCHFFHRFKSDHEKSGVHPQRSSYQSWHQVSQAASFVQQTSDSYQSFNTSSCSYSTAAHVAQSAQTPKTESTSSTAVNASADPSQDQDDTEDEQLQIDEDVSHGSPVGDVHTKEVEQVTFNEKTKEKAETTKTDGSVDSLIQSEVLQKIIMESVKKYLSKTPLLANIEPSQLVSQLDTSAIAQSISTTKNESSSDDSSSAVGPKKKRLYPRPPGIPDYKPTPIKELQRRKSTERKKDKFPKSVSDQESEVTDFSSAEEEPENVNSDAADSSAKKTQVAKKDTEVSINLFNTISKENDKEVPSTLSASDSKDVESSSKSQGPSHILVPAVTQVTRKAWKPGAVKASKAPSNSPCTPEDVLQGLDRPTEDNESKLEGCTSQHQIKADLNKERESLSTPVEKTGCEVLEEKKTSDEEIQNTNSIDGGLNDPPSSSAVTTESGKEGEMAEKESKAIDNDQISPAESDFSIHDRSYSPSSGSSSSRERRKRRKKRKREKKMKRKHSKSKKRRRRYSSSFEADSESERENEDEREDIDDRIEVKKEKNSNDEDEGSLSETPSQRSTKSVNRRREEDSDYSTCKRYKSKSRRRKHSKHRKKSKKKHRKHRYHSSDSMSSNSDYESNSDSEFDKRSRKRRRDIDLSIVKPDPEDVIDLTVIKDESESDDALNVCSTVKVEASPVSDASVLLETKTSDEVIPSIKKENQEAKKDSVLGTDVDTRKSKSRTTSVDSSATIPFDGNQLDQDKSPSPAALSPEGAPEPTSCPDESKLIPPSTSDVPVIEKPAAVFSKKTKTLKEISIFDSLLDGTASNRIKTVTKKRVEEHSSSSITPTLTDDDDHLKVTKTVTSRSSTTSTRHSSSDGRSSKTSTNSHVKKSVKSHSSHSPASSSSSSLRHLSSTRKSDEIDVSHRDKSEEQAKARDSSSSTTSSSSFKHKSTGGSRSESKSRDKASSKTSSSSTTKSSSSSDKISSSNTKSASASSRSSSSSRSISHSSTRRHSSSSQDRKSSSSRDKPDHSPSAGADSSHSSASAASQPVPAVSSQESDCISDREFFNFNHGPSHTSQSSEEEALFGNRDCFSPLPDLSALDTIPEEDWHQLTALDNEKGSEAAEDECLKLYNDFTPPSPAPLTQGRKRAAPDDSVDEPVSTIKRIARPDAPGNLLRRPHLSSYPGKRKSAQQVMMERYDKLLGERASLKRDLDNHRQMIDNQHKKLKLENSTSGGSRVSSSQPSSASSPAAGPAFPLGSREPRIGAVTNVSALLSAGAALKQRLPSSSSAGRPSAAAAAPSSVTVASAGAKGTKRIAHVPKVEVLARPVIAAEFGGKVPQNVRQRYLNSFIDEALKFAECPSEAFKIALSEEKVCYGRAGSRAVYLSLAVNTTKRLRSGVVSDQAKKLIDGVDLSASTPGPAATSSQSSHPINPNHRVQSHFSTLAGGGQKGSWSIEKPVKTDYQAKFNSLKGPKLYEFVQRYLMTKEQLTENCYPFPHPDVKGKAICKIDSRTKISPSATERYCSRCSTLYLVDKWGFPKTIASCAYHWGRANKRRVATGIESRYACCQGDQQSEGCCLASTHVSDNISPDNFTGFVRTLPKDPPTPGDYGIYALDCEMCYTTAGSELTRVTVVDHNSTVVYETFVQPDNQILDYNTRFSGISEEQLEDVTTTLRDVQAALLTRFSEKTILVGHSLESDFKALKLIHHYVIDTSVMFPHKMGPPYKRALRYLASDHLKKIIQNDVSGHDSAEDAITCMELLHWKIKEDLKASPV